MKRPFLNTCMSLNTESALNTYSLRDSSIVVGRSQSDLDEERVLEDGWTYTLEEVRSLHQENWEIEWDHALRLVKTTTRPEGLVTACIDTSCVEAALQELRPFLEETYTFEVGWQTYATYDDNSYESATSYEAAALSAFPCLRQLLRTVMHTLGEERSLDERLSVICWRYVAPGGMSMHYDKKDLFAEDVFGCVLWNSSNRTLEFHEDVFACTDQQRCYTVAEQPGSCYWMTGPARFDWKHGISQLKEGERISVTWRWFKPFVKLKVSSSRAGQSAYS